MTKAQLRRRIIQRSRAMLAEIRQMRIDAEYWNEHVRQPHDAPINPDPGGDMARIELHCERVLRDFGGSDQ